MAVAPPVGRVTVPLVAAGVAGPGRVLLAGLSRRPVVAVSGRRALVSMPRGRAVIAVVVVFVPLVSRRVAVVGVSRSGRHVVLPVPEGQTGRGLVSLRLARQAGRDVVAMPAGQTLVSMAVVGVGRSPRHVVLLGAEGEAGRDVVAMPAGQTMVPMALLDVRG